MLTDQTTIHWDQQEHVHDFCEISLLRNDGGWTWLKGKRVANRTGRMIFFPPQVSHIAAGTPESPARVDYICFQSGMVAENPVLLRLVQQLQTEATISDGEPAPVLQLWDALQDEFSRVSPHRQAMLEAFLLQILVHHLRRMSRRTTEAGPDPAGRLPGLCAEIAEHPERPITLPETAKRAGMSRSAFAKAFRIYTGMTLMEYVLGCRIRRAEELLRNPNTTVTDVCMDCGFNNVSHFYRIFQRHNGMSPGAYAKLFRR